MWVFLQNKSAHNNGEICLKSLHVNQTQIAKEERERERERERVQGSNIWSVW